MKALALSGSPMRISYLLIVGANMLLAAAMPAFAADLQCSGDETKSTVNDLLRQVWVKQAKAVHKFGLNTLDGYDLDVSLSSPFKISYIVTTSRTEFQVTCEAQIEYKVQPSLQSSRKGPYSGELQLEYKLAKTDDGKIVVRIDNANFLLGSE